MRRRAHWSGWLLMLVLALVIWPARLTSAATLVHASLRMTSDPGDIIGEGGSYDFDETTGTFDVVIFHSPTTGEPDYLEVRYNAQAHPTSSWSVAFSTQELGVPLAPGRYNDARRPYSTVTNHPGLDVVGMGFGCNRLSGWFELHTVVISGYELLALDASFEQHCEMEEPALHGHLVYQTDADLTPPATGVSLSGPQGANGWFLGPVVATIAATDSGGSGVAATYAALGQTTPVTVTGPLTVTARGISTLLAYSRDQAGNTEPGQRWRIKIDPEMPRLAATKSTMRDSAGVLHGVVQGRITDATSGIRRRLSVQVHDEYGIHNLTTSISTAATGDYVFTFPMRRPRQGDAARRYRVTLIGLDQAGQRVVVVRDLRYWASTTS